MPFEPLWLVILMRIAYLAAGAAGMYCGSCLHDNTLAAQMLKMGEDVVLVPIYTPIRTDESDVSEQRVFFGGINVYLQQKWKLFRHLPRWIDRWLDHPAILRQLSGRADSVDPSQLGDLTVSMLRGESGNQLKELEALVDWLIDEVKPDVVHLSNSMMLGLARMIAERCGPPVVCSLSGEDIFIEQLPPPYYQQVRQLLRERVADVHAFVALNEYYANFMSDYLSVEREKIRVIPHGLNLEGHSQRAAENLSSAPRIGYLARVCHEKGLHLLVDACEQLAERPEFVALELHAAGYLGSRDRPYLAEIQQRVSEGTLAGRFRYVGELDRAQKIAFIQSLHVFSTPTIYRESKGLPALEAMANGVPVVLPNHGSFTELITDTQAGLLHEPENSTDLANTLAEIISNPVKAEQLGSSGRLAVEDRYHAAEMAQQTLSLYAELVV